jgi:hypothetical protein
METSQWSYPFVPVAAVVAVTLVALAAVWL